jgi:hypothetical protein
MKPLIFTVCILSLLLSGCASTPETTAPPPTIITTTPASFSSVTPTPSPAALPTNPNVTPTPDLRLPPEKWQTWPVVPTVSARAREIYQKGLALGNDPRAFSKIGDCQSVRASLLGIYDTDRYFFAPEYQYLQETVNAFAGSFDRDGESVRGGFNASSVLLPIWAMSSEACQPGENPMECENRVHNPSIVFISLERSFDGRTPEVYENYLRQIIEYNLEQGTLPILATKADNVEGDHSINYTIAKLSYEYDLPLWNFWLAVQSLPNHGLDPTDPDGFHLLKPDGWNRRSFTALQVLDAVRRATADLTADETSLATASAPTAAPVASFTPGPVSGLPFTRVESIVEAASASPSILLGFSIQNQNRIESAGIFQGALTGQNWLALAETGLTLLDHSDAGIIAAQGQNLYLLKDSARTLLTSQLISDTGQPAILLADGRVAAILQTESGNQLAIFSEDAPQFLPAAVNAPQTLYPSRDPNRFYWGAGKCAENGCPAEGEIVATPLNDSASTVIPFTGQPAFAADGKMAFMSRDAEGKNLLTLVNGDQTQPIPFYGNRLVNMSWSPDGSTLAVGVSLVSDYSGLVLRSRLYFVTWPYSVDQVADLADETIEGHAWSPDGKSLLVIKRKFDGAEYHITFTALDAARQTEIPALGFQLVSEKYLLLQPVFWIP